MTVKLFWVLVNLFVAHDSVLWNSNQIACRNVRAVREGEVLEGHTLGIH